MKVHVYLTERSGCDLNQPSRERLPSIADAKIPYDREFMHWVGSNFAHVKEYIAQQLGSHKEKCTLQAERKSFIDALDGLEKVVAGGGFSESLTNLFDRARMLNLKLQGLAEGVLPPEFEAFAENLIYARRVDTCLKKLDLRKLGTAVTELQLLAKDIQAWRDERDTTNREINEVSEELQQKQATLAKLSERLSRLDQKGDLPETTSLADQTIAWQGKQVSKVHGAKQKAEAAKIQSRDQKEKAKLPSQIAARQEEIEALEEKIQLTRLRLIGHESLEEAVRSGNDKLQIDNMELLNRCIGEVSHEIDAQIKMEISAEDILREETQLFYPVWEEVAATIISAVKLDVAEERADRIVFETSSCLPVSAIFGPLFTQAEANRLAGIYMPLVMTGISMELGHSEALTRKNLNIMFDGNQRSTEHFMTFERLLKYVYKYGQYPQMLSRSRRNDSPLAERMAADLLVGAMSQLYLRSENFEAIRECLILAPESPSKQTHNNMKDFRCLFTSIYLCAAAKVAQEEASRIMAENEHTF